MIKLEMWQWRKALFDEIVLHEDEMLRGIRNLRTMTYAFEYAGDVTRRVDFLVIPLLPSSDEL